MDWLHYSNQKLESEAPMQKTGTSPIECVITVVYLLLMLLLQFETSIASESEKGEIWREPITGMEFVWVSGGCYLMGNKDGDWDQKPEHEVCVDGFWIGRYEVTNSQYVAFLNSLGKRGSEATPWIETEDEDYYSEIILTSGEFSTIEGKEQYPVINVSWFGAKAFVDWLSEMNGFTFGLPTEAEWEYACTSGGKDGKDESGMRIHLRSWHRKNSHFKTHKVGTLSPNKLGVYNLNGNVWEWCMDVYDKNAYAEHERFNPVFSGSSENLDENRIADRVIRGGGCRSWPKYTSCTNRFYSEPSTRMHTRGFRVIKRP